MIPLRTRQGVHLIVTALLNAPTSQLSASEIYEWLAKRYPRYKYTKDKVRHVLRHDSERQLSRFVIANDHRLPGVPIRWAIRPGTENQLHQLFDGPPPPEPQLHCVLCNQVFDRHESFVRHQREAHSSDGAMSPAVQKEMGSVLNASAAIAADQEWEICGILNHKDVDGIEYFLVDWVPTWVPEHECGNARAIIGKYKACGCTQSKNMNQQDRWPQSKVGQQEVARARATCNVQRKRGRGRPRKQSARGYVDTGVSGFRA